ncbi:MAG: M16 family metallopeptidase, partial [Candidatus Eiseniibacteriota bacterium]
MTSQSTSYGTRFIARVSLTVALVALGMAIVSPAPTAMAGVKPPTVKLDYEKYTLPNGLEVILREDHRLPMVAVNTWYHVGPANETAGKTGFAHLFEHMMFQSSGHVGEDQFWKYMEGAGASFI